MFRFRKSIFSSKKKLKQLNSQVFLPIVPLSLQFIESYDALAKK